MQDCKPKPEVNFNLQAKLETKALKAKRPGFTDDRYSETSYYVESGELEWDVLEHARV